MCTATRTEKSPRSTSCSFGRSLCASAQTSMMSTQACSAGGSRSRGSFKAEASTPLCLAGLTSTRICRKPPRERRCHSASFVRDATAAEANFEAESATSTEPEGWSTACTGTSS
eukprot:scaffold77121_cov27-Tisochrysis_lutea.AAC.4